MIAIVKYNAGNIRSMTYALNRLGVEPVLTDDPEQLRQAEKVIFPGVGEASSAMQYLRKAGLDRVLRELKQPFLGVCLGMQLMCRHSEEGDTECLGMFDLPVRRFARQNEAGQAFKVPHMGWNRLTDMKGPLFEGLGEAPYVYFVHSYYVPDNPYTIATADYVQPFCAALHRDNYYAAQFHPEKSSTLGEKILKNFLDL
jgi:glutamine amidotransferase